MKKLILGMILGLLIGHTAVGVTGLVNKPFTFTPLTPAKSAEVNQNFDTIYNEFNGNITNANISSGAAIAYSKLNLTGSIINSDINSNAAIAGSKLNLVGKITMPDFFTGTIQPTSSPFVLGTARQILCGTGLSGCGDLSSDRTLSIVDNTTTQKVFWSDNTNIYLRRWGAFLPSSEITALVADDAGSDRVSITFSLNSGSVVNSKLKTATGSASVGAPGDTTVNMNDYSFFPSVTSDEATGKQLWVASQADPGDTIGRLRINNNVGGTQPVVVRWRYVTASRSPELVLLQDSGGQVVGVWLSQIDSDEPPMSAAGMESVYVAKFPDRLLNLDAEKIFDDLRKGKLQLDCGGNPASLNSHAQSRGRFIYKGAKLCEVG